MIRLWMLAALSGFLLIPAFPPFSHGALAWAALVPLFWAVLDCPTAKQAARFGAVAGLVFYGYSLFWMSGRELFGPLGAFIFICVFILWISLQAVLLWTLWRRFALKRPGWGPELALVILGGLFWVGLEYFRSELWVLKNSWLALGYSQVSNLPLLQSASLFGNYGLSAFIVGVNLSLCLFLRGRRRTFLILALLFLALGSWGWHRLAVLDTRSGRPLRVALLQEEDSPRTAAFLSALPEVHEAGLYVWPEDQFDVLKLRPDGSLKRLTGILHGIDAVSVIGCRLYSEPADSRQKAHMENFCWVLSRRAGLEGRYDKSHPVPLVEAFLEPNPDPRPINTEAGRLGVQICYDLDFEDVSRKLARQGAQLLVVPTYDPMVWGPRQHLLHSGMSPMRAVETGLWLVRAASSGESQIIDPLGRVQSEMAPGEVGVLTGRAYLGRSGTFYTRLGWLSGPGCFAATCFYLAWLCWAWFRTKATPCKMPQKTQC